MLLRSALMLAASLLLCGPASAATADQAAVSWTLRATSIEPYARHDYDPKPGTTPIAGPPGWTCTGYLFEVRYAQKPTVGRLTLRCAKGDTAIATMATCVYLDKPKPGMAAKGAYWTSGPYDLRQAWLEVNGVTWEFSVGCSVSSRHSDK